VLPASELLTVLSLNAEAARAQTPVTTSGGTANTLPTWTGTSAKGNSILTESSGRLSQNKETSE
jgi:hypothetical protein